MFQHTAARRRLASSIGVDAIDPYVSTHSRPKAAGYHTRGRCGRLGKFQHTAARRRLAETAKSKLIEMAFQHTAARRRLVLSINHNDSFTLSFNTQPPEGGWASNRYGLNWSLQFQHTAARRRLGIRANLSGLPTEFQHTAARRRLDRKRRSC